MATPALEVIGARRSFGGQTALDGTDLHVAAGELYALLGPNGAGKSTLLRAIAGRVRLDAGRVRVLGRDPVAEPEARRAIGIVPQGLALYPELTALENLEVLGRLAGLSRRRAAAAAGEALGWVGLTDRAGALAGRLSGGQQRRLNLAAGVLHEPALLLLDEPTAGVDPAARERVHELLRELRRRGTAMLLATHDLEQAAELADRLGILDAGRIHAQGTLAELVAAHLGDGGELRLRLVDPPDERAQARLREVGLAQGHDPRDWSGPIEGLETIGRLVAALAAEGIRAAEARLRESGLAGVFFRVVGRGLEP